MDRLILIHSFEELQRLAPPRAGEVLLCAIAIRPRDELNALVLQTLAHWTNSPVTDWRREDEEDGKPYYFRRDKNEFEVSVSHTKDIAVIGITRGGALGVDVEYIRPVRHDRNIAGRFFSESEAALVQSPEGESYFWELWTLKEAVTKNRGVPLLKTIKKIEFEPRGRDLVLKGLPAGWPPLTEWELRTFCLTSKYMVSCAFTRA